MSEKPILFNTEMVRAILDGRKTQTRRLMKRHIAPVLYDDNIPAPDRIRMNAAGTMSFDWSGRVIGGFDLKMPCKPGDVLYVRETWKKVPGVPPYIYKATYSVGEVNWRPSIHMPKEAARLFLRVTDVRVERLRDGLGCLQALQAEGVKSTTFPSILFEFKELWNSTIKPADLPRYGWGANPWVWVIEFERISKPFN